MFIPSFSRPLYSKTVPVLHERARKSAKCTLTPPTEEHSEQPRKLQPQSQLRLLPQSQFIPAVPRKQSLPTHRERLYLQSLHITRPKGRAPRFARVQNTSLMAWPLIHAPQLDAEERTHPVQPIPPWAYIVRVQAAKSVLGKGAVVRNKAKRRIRAAAARIMPGHAKRGWEYVFAPGQGAVEVEFETLVNDIEECLRSIGAWKDELVLEEVVREVYCNRYR